MAAIEWETGVQVVIEGRERPVAAVVASCAVIAQRIAVRIVVGMTHRTVRRYIVETVARMTFAARHRGVQTREWKPAQIVVESRDARPGRLLVALDTVFAELAGVRIVNRMAVPTGGQHLPHRGFFVAGAAGEVRVRAFERKPGGRMHERRVRPHGWPMAALALAPVATLVIVVDGVAVVARFGKRILEVFS